MFAGGGLLVEGRGQVAVARLEFGKQPDIFDGDHRLIGERLEQRDLAVGEWPGLCAPHSDRAERDTVAQHGDRKDASKAGRPAERGQVLEIKLDIGHVDYGAFEDRPTHTQSPAGPGGPYVAGEIERFGIPVVCRFEVHHHRPDLIEAAL